VEVNQSNENDLKGLLNAALEISRKRTDLLEQMRTALKDGDDQEALRLGRELCGMHKS